MTIIRHITAMVMAAVLLSCNESDVLDNEITQQQRDPVDYSTFTASIDTSVTTQKITRASSYTSSDKPDLTICFDDDTSASYTYDVNTTQYLVDEDETMGENALYVYSDTNSAGAMVAAAWPSLFQYDATTTIELKNMNPMIRVSYKHKNDGSITTVGAVSLKNVFSKATLSMKGTQLINTVVESDTPTSSVNATVTTTLDSEDILSESELAEEEAAVEAEAEDTVYKTGTYELYTVPQTLCGYQGYIEVIVDGETLPYYFSHEVTLQSGYLYDLIVEVKSVDNALTLEVEVYEYEEWDEGGNLAVNVDLNNSVLDVWDGLTVSTELEGNGIEENPYLINSAADLKLVTDLIAADVKAGTTTSYLAASYKMTKNIDWDNNSLAAIGSSSAQFIGIFNGAGCTIKNVMISNDSTYSGFFAVIGDGTTDGYKGQVKNLTISNITVTASTSAQECGVLAGLVKESGLIENCHVFNSRVTAGGAAGGIAGGQLGAIIGCIAENTTVTSLNTTITSGTTRAFAGGITGLIWSVATVQLSHSLALNCTVNGLESYTAGIVGSPWNAWAGGFVVNSFASNVVSDNESLYGVSGLYAANGNAYALTNNNYHDIDTAIDTTYCLDDSYTLQQKANLLNGNEIDTVTELGDTPMWYWGVDEQSDTPYPYYYDPNSQDQI